MRKAAFLLAAAGALACTAPPRVNLAPDDSVDSTLAAATFDSAWSVIQRTYYDSAMRGIDWHAVRSELRPRAAAATSQRQLRAALAQMLERLGESHFAIIPSERKSALGAGGGSYEGDAGIHLRLLDDRVIVVRVDASSPAERAGVRPGWELRAVGGTAVDSIVRSLRAALDQSERLLPLQAVRRLENVLAGDPGSFVEAEFDAPQAGRRRLRLERAPVRGQVVTFGHLPAIVASVESQRMQRDGYCVGIVRFNAWMAPIAARLDSALSSFAACRGIVVDLRGNPGGLAAMVMGLAGHFLATPDSLGTLRLRGTTLHLVANPRFTRVRDTLVGPFTGRVAIVIDELSASTSEIFAAGMRQLGRARVFGTRSPGLALPAQIAALPNGDVLMHVIADFTLPGGRRVEGEGVIPDVEVPLSADALLSGRDPALDLAVEWAGNDNR